MLYRFLLIVNLRGGYECEDYQPIIYIVWVDVDCELLWGVKDVVGGAILTADISA